MRFSRGWVEGRERKKNILDTEYWGVVGKEYLGVVFWVSRKFLGWVGLSLWEGVLDRDFIVWIVGSYGVV